MADCKRVLCSMTAVSLVVFSGCSSERLDRHLRRGDQFYARGRYREAAIEYTHVLRLNRSHPKALRQLAFCRYELGDLREAGQLLLAARQVDPSNPEIEIRLGKLHLLAKNFKEAYEIASSLLASCPTNHEAVLLLCESSVMSQQWDRAVAVLEQSGLKAARPTTFHLALGNVHLRRGDKVTAEEHYRRACEADPKAALPHEALGKLYVSKGDFPRAEEEFRLAAELEPPGARARLLLAEMKLEREEYEEAKKILEETVSSSPTFTPALVLLGRIALGERDYSRALEIAERIVGKRPSDFAGLLLRTQALFAKGDLDQARRECEKLAKHFPDSGAVHHQMALIHVRQNDPKKAVVALKKAVECDPNHMPARLLLAELQMFSGELSVAIRSLEEIVREHPGVLRGHLLLGTALRANQQPERAVAVYEKARELFPQEARLSYGLGAALHEYGQEEQAAIQFERTLTLKPGWIAPLTHLVIRDVKKKDFDGAIRRVNEQMDKTDSKAEMKVLLGKIRFLQKNYADAESDLLEAIRLNPNLPSAYQLLATIYTVMRRDADALRKLEEAIAVNPRDVTSMMLAAAIYQRTNRKEKAIELYERVLAVKPRFVPAANNLAYLYIETPGKLDRALELAQMARDTAPNDPYVADTLGWVFHNKGDLRRALGLLRESVEHLSDQPEALYHLGATYYKLGNIKAAQDILAKSMAVESEFPGRETIRAMLHVLNLDPQKKPNDTIVETLRAHLAGNPNDPLALYRQAQFFHNEGRTEDALRVYEALVRDHPQFVPAHVALAKILVANPATKEKGLTLVRKARDLAPDDPEILGEIGWLAYHAGDFSWANSLLQQVVSLLPKDGRVALRFGWSLYMLGRVEDAIKELQRAVSLGLPAGEVESAQEAITAMRIWIDSTRQKEAVRAHALKAQAEKRGDLPSLMLVARAYEYERKPGEAMKIYEDIFKRYPEFVPAAAELALLQVETGGDLAKAYKLAMMARDRLPKDVRVAEILGVVAYHRGNFEWAANLAAEALATFPDDITAMYYRALALCQLGREREAARTMLRRALDAAPQHRMADEARRKLSELSSGE